MKEENILTYYVLCNRLKNLLRTGWLSWNVKRERIESVAEHIYSTQMLALAIYSEYHYDIDIFKVILMLAIHETEEIIIGDLTPYQTTIEDKEKMGHQAILKVLEPLNIGSKLVDIILEFDAHKSKESLFAYYCDKLECDLQCKLYDEENCVDLKQQAANKITENKDILKLIDEGNGWSDLWIKNDLYRIGFDNNFENIANFALVNNLHDLVNKK